MPEAWANINANQRYAAAIVKEAHKVVGMIDSRFRPCISNRGTVANVRRSSEMPKFFFDFNVGGLDDTGVELADRSEAWKHATAECGRLLTDLDGDLRPYQEVRMTVRDEWGSKLFSVYFGADSS